jgi:predicted enzyme related to lactoylglutathione lyase
MIAEFEKVVVDVPDLERGLAFWGALTGLAPRYVDPAGKFMGLGSKVTKGETNSVILLQLVDHMGSGGSTHIDLKVDDVAAAIPKIEALGGKLKKAPGFYPDKESALLEWAVMQDPWGTPFCIIRSPV